MPSSLTTVLSHTLVFSTCQPVSVLVRANIQLTLETFLESWNPSLHYYLTGSLLITSLPYIADLPTIQLLCLTVLFQSYGLIYPSLSFHHLYIGYWNINQLSIDYAFQPDLRSRLTLGGRAFPRKPSAIGVSDSH